MVDPISIITLSASIIARCYDYGCKVADAPAEAQQLVNAVSNLSAVLVSIQGLWVQNSIELNRLRLPHALEACEVSLNRIKARLDSHTAKASGSRSKQLLGRLTWPLKRGETLENLQLIEEQKSTLSLILESFTSQKVVESRIELKQISEGIRALNTASQSAEDANKDLEILDWICSYEHQTQHDNARQAHCVNTSSWIIDHSSFKHWKQSHGKLFWLSGLPGSGKTILTSHIIEHLSQESVTNGSTVLYFYFDRSTNQTLAVQNFLASIIRQLCAQQGVSSHIREIFTSSKRPGGGIKPAEMLQLRAMFQERAPAADAIYLIVDAVDEASDPEDVCEMLEWLLQSSGTNINCFMSSRPLPSTSSLHVSYRVAASEENVNHDISTYIHSRFSGEPRLKRMKPELKKFVRQDLLSRACGMFRLAQCQLDEISKLRTDAAVKATLSTLPRTLEASYSRMVERIDESDLSFARRVLLWLAHAFRPLHLPAIAEAAVFEPGMSTIEDEARLSDSNDVLDICGMFVFHNDIQDEVRLAHHTVREFLVSAADSLIYLPKKQSHHDLAELCLSYLLMDNLPGPAKSRRELMSLFHRYPLLAYAATCWVMHVREAECEEALQPLILRLMTSHPTPRFMLWLQVVLWHSNHGFRRPSFTPESHPTPLYYASSYGLYHTVKSLIAAGADLNVRAGRYGGTAYHAACWRQHPEIVRLLLEAGIDADIKDGNGMTAFDLLELSGFEDVAEVAREYDRSVKNNFVAEKKLEQALRASYLHMQQQKREAFHNIPAGVGAARRTETPVNSARKEESNEKTIHELE